MYNENILILAKTYPVPSAKYDETTCVAGINENGEMRRLFPIQFRFMHDEKQFKKWQWVDAKIKKAPKDHRPESYIIDPESITCGKAIDTKDNWERRRRWINQIPSFNTLQQLEAARQTSHITLAILNPISNLRVEITPERNPEWTKEEISKLLKNEMQGDLFQDNSYEKKVLQKIPFSFHYHYTLMDLDGCEHNQKHKILDWEICQLYRNCRQKHNAAWEVPFRKKLEEDIGEKDLRLLMGTIHRFPDQWLIISLIYPPKRTPGTPEQRPLF